MVPRAEHFEPSYYPASSKSRRKRFITHQSKQSTVTVPGGQHHRGANHVGILWPTTKSDELTTTANFST